jgi:hypothetical protein
MIREACRRTFWAITCYFNPIGYKRRIENYRLFRERLALPLVTVELSFDGAFQLRHDDADIVVQLHGRDIMWQKERLLNLALKSLPDRCDKVAWLDCDVIFASDDWVERADLALDEFLLLHLFQERHDLPRDARPDHLESWPTPSPAISMIHRMAVEGVAPEALLLTHPRKDRRSANGLAWASPRAVLEEHGLYDACILGSGDRAVLCAALGTFDYCTRGLLMNAQQERHYLAWARPYFAVVRGRVGYIPGRAFHLWHGEVADRQYGERDRALQAFDFDPFSDIATDDDGCWRWNSNKPALHVYIRRYFESRNEDGA